MPSIRRNGRAGKYRSALLVLFALVQAVLFAAVAKGQIPASAALLAVAAGSQKPATADREAELNKQIDAVLAQQEIVRKRAEELAPRKAQLEADLLSFRTEGLDEKPPYPLSLLDRIREELAAERARAETTDAAVEAGKQAVEEARAKSEQRQRERRLAKDAVRSGSDPSAATAGQGELAQAELACRLADETLKLRQAELSNEQLSAEIQQLVLALLEAKRDAIADATQFTKSELQARLAEIGQMELQTNASIQLAELNRSYNEHQWSDARSRLDAATDDRAVIAEELEAWRLARQKRQEELAMLNRRLQRLGEMRTAWTRRHHVFHHEPSDEELAGWQQETESILDALERDAFLRRSQADQVRKDLATIDAKKDAGAEGPEQLARWFDEQRRQLQGMLGGYEAAILSIESSQRLHRRLLEELRDDAQFISAGEWPATIWKYARGVWNYELIAVDDRAITVGKFVGGVTLFFFGVWLSRLLSRMLEIRLRMRWRVNRDAAVILRTISFYTLLVLFSLFALRLVNVPLTVFTFIGGALAIGLGLGSQGLVNNFLSGLVIMAERPLRLGERVLYSGYDGFVEDVGYRCTKLRTLDGHVVTVPNSNVLNDAVENIGRRPFIRRKFNLTITYDTSRANVERAVDIVHGILAEEGIRDRIHPIVAGEDYPPQVYFNEFNADSLNLMVIYWFVPPDYWEYCRHAQKVNLRIFEEFEKAGIDFAFPTQTLHLAGDPKRELGVRMRQPRPAAQPVSPEIEAMRKSA